MQGIVIASLLMTIVRESESVHVGMRDLLQAGAVDGSPEHIMARCELRHACNLLTSRIAELQRTVVALDHKIAGSEVMSLAELGLRSQTAAILLVLDELYAAVREDVASFADLYTKTLRTVDDVIGRVLDVLAKANRRWLSSRVLPWAIDEASIPKAIETSRALVRRVAVRRAVREIAALSIDPDLTHFVRVGCSRDDVPDVRAACEQLRQLLAFKGIREPDPELLLAAAVLEPEQLFDYSDDGMAVRRPSGQL
jgi:hypothetical protein